LHHGRDQRTLLAVRLFVTILSLAVSLLSARAAEISFVRDVMPVISRAGCNGGGCHGHRDGKGGFKLSLWGESPSLDLKAILDSEKRANLKDPLASRLLRKPTLQTEHEGEKRFEVDSPEYAILRQWLETGAPDDTASSPSLLALEVTPPSQILVEPETEVQLRIEATFADGEKRDVTYWSVYALSNLEAEVSREGRVRFGKPGETTVIVRYLDRRVSARLALVPARPDFAWSATPEANYIDTRVFEKLRTFRMNPSDVCDDATFVRRVFLDILGIIPNAEEARAFVSNPDPEKRAKLVDALLDRPEYAEFWALKWSDILRNEEKVLDKTGVGKFYGWLRDGLAEGKGLDRLARELITARGSTYENPPANYYRALRDPVDRAEATAQVFLGARLRCAKCHNHPFDRWTQDEYYEFAALFDGIDYKIMDNQRKDKFDKNQFVGEQEVELVSKREFKDPRTKKKPVARLLGSETPPIAEDRDRFEQLADWITAPENPLFARVQANRIWFHMIGRGLVDPVDDFRATNPPSHPELLDALARDLAEGGYDPRHLIRRIANSRVYQLASETNATNADDTLNYSHAPTPRLPAETLLDSLHAAFGLPAKFKQYDKLTRATAMPGIDGPYLDKDPHDDDRFLRLFGKPPRLLSSDAERLNDTSLAQVFELTSGQTVNSLLEAKDNRIEKLLSSGQDDPALLESLYWSTVTRAPTETERASLLAYLAERPGEARRAAFQDIAWALVNSKEFMFRH
jgi:hypothetical protein